MSFSRHSSDHSSRPRLVELTQLIAEALVEHPTELRVTQEKYKIVIRTKEGDEALIVGRKGRVIEAIRTVVRAAATRDVRIVVDSPPLRRHEHTQQDKLQTQSEPQTQSEEQPHND